MTRYSSPSPHPRRFRESHDAWYSRLAGAYDLAVRVLPTWKSWLHQALPHIQGPRVLEVSFGTGYLMTQYAGRFEVHGIDFNRRLVRVARRNLRRAGVVAALARAAVEALPYRDGTFDCVVNTMALSGYPDAATAMGEMARVLRPGGRLVIIDINYPRDGNRIGTALTRAWRLTGDMIWDMDTLFRGCSLAYEEQEIGGYGSVHLYTAAK